MSYWKQYVSQNPMRAETRRAFRRFFGMGKRGTRAIQVGALVIVVLYALSLFLFFIGGGLFPIPVWVFMQVLVLLLVASIGFYGTISGERERRSWDLLRVAPVTRGQIVAGKFLGGLQVLCAVWLAMLPFLLISGFFADSNNLGDTAQAITTNFGTRFLLTFLASLTAVLGAACALSVTMLMSARCKSSVGALSTSLGFLAVWNVVFPMFLGPLGAGEVMGPINPFVVAMDISGRVQISSNERAVDPIHSFLVFCVCALIATAGMVIWTERTLTFVENDVRFMPRRNDA